MAERNDARFDDEAISRMGAEGPTPTLKVALETATLPKRVDTGITRAASIGKGVRDGAISAANVEAASRAAQIGPRRPA